MRKPEHPATPKEATFTKETYYLLTYRGSLSAKRGLIKKEKRPAPTKKVLLLAST
jgi:hypothetical protein